VLVAGIVLGYSTLCVCWIAMCQLFGILLCCVGLCRGLLCVGGCKWRVGVAMCQFRDLGKSVQLGLGYVSGLKMLLWWSPMCWAYRNFKVCVIYASNMP